MANYYQNIRNTKLCLGIDEAGRGCVIGPLVLAGVVTTPQDDKALKDMGCTDSKNFGSGLRAREIRSKMAKEICRRCTHTIKYLHAEEIDIWLYTQSLNAGERFLAQQIIAQTPFDYAILDGKRIFTELTNDRVFACNKADTYYPSVMAASIVAKDYRDTMLADIFEQLGFPNNLKGGGYVNKNTLEIVKHYVNKHGKLPHHLRRSYNWQALQLWCQTKQMDA